MENNSAYVGVHLAKLSVLYGVVLKDEQLEIYLEELGHLTTKQADEAFKHIRQTFKPSGPNPFPSIPDILSAVGESPNDGGLVAIAAVRQAARTVGRGVNISFCNPALHYVIKTFGGWEKICIWEDKDWNTNGRRMLDTYNEALRSGLDGGNHLAGASWGLNKVVVINLETGKKDNEFASLNDHTVKMLNLLCYGEPDTPTPSIVDKSGGMARFPVQGLINQICKLSA